ncbi:MAG TPA: hypothetical protein VLC46_00035 [Thermoanaerobaculia bacterium]|jgi:hypothetical protein|nr:hypothetical protein [Thermoanaerobaculia bacterium]
MAGIPSSRTSGVPPVVCDYLMIATWLGDTNMDIASFVAGYRANAEFYAKRDARRMSGELVPEGARGLFRGASR